VATCAADRDFAVTGNVGQGSCGGWLRETQSRPGRENRHAHRAEHATGPGRYRQGFAADKALEVLKRHGLPRALVAASGDIAIGDPPRTTALGALALGHSTPIALISQEISSSATQRFRPPGTWNNSSKSAANVTRTSLIRARDLTHRAVAGDDRWQKHDRYGLLRHGGKHIERGKGMKLVESQPGMAAVILRKDGDRIEAFESRRFKRIPQAR